MLPGVVLAQIMEMMVLQLEGGVGGMVLEFIGGVVNIRVVYISVVEDRVVESRMVEDRVVESRVMEGSVVEGGLEEVLEVEGEAVDEAVIIVQVPEPEMALNGFTITPVNVFLQVFYS